MLKEIANDILDGIDDLKDIVKAKRERRKMIGFVDVKDLGDRFLLTEYKKNYIKHTILTK